MIKSIMWQVLELTEKLKLSEQEIGCGKLNSTELLSSTALTFAQAKGAHISLIKEERLSQSCFEASLKLEADETAEVDEASVDRTGGEEAAGSEGEEDEDEEEEEEEEEEDEEMETEGESSEEEDSGRNDGMFALS